MWRGCGEARRIYRHYGRILAMATGRRICRHCRSYFGDGYRPLARRVEPAGRLSDFQLTSTAGAAVRAEKRKRKTSGRARQGLRLTHYWPLAVRPGNVIWWGHHAIGCNCPSPIRFAPLSAPPSATLATPLRIGSDTVFRYPPARPLGCVHGVWRGCGEARRICRHYRSHFGDGYRPSHLSTLQVAFWRRLQASRAPCGPAGRHRDFLLTSTAGAAVRAEKGTAAHGQACG